MPTMPASVGTSVGWNGKLASLPRTKKTVSPTPAPTASTATSVRPAFDPSAAIGCRTISLMPVRFSSFRVVTTSPMTFASCIVVEADLQVRLVPRCDFHRVNDADDRGIDGTVLHSRRHPRGAAADDEHRFADSGVHRVDSDEIVPFGFAVRVHLARDQQLVADQPRILPRRDNGTDDAREDHEGRTGSLDFRGGRLADRQRVLEVRVRAR